MAGSLCVLRPGRLRFDVVRKLAVRCGIEEAPAPGSRRRPWRRVPAPVNDVRSGALRRFGLWRAPGGGGGGPCGASGGDQARPGRLRYAAAVSAGSPGLGGHSVCALAAAMPLPDGLPSRCGGCGLRIEPRLILRIDVPCGDGGYDLRSSSMMHSSTVRAIIPAGCGSYAGRLCCRTGGRRHAPRPTRTPMAVDTGEGGAGPGNGAHGVGPPVVGGAGRWSTSSLFGLIMILRVVSYAQ